MRKVLFAWELGANVGHIARDMPVARLLRSRGYEILFAARDLRQAQQLLTPEDFACVQAPRFVGGKADVPPASYGEILLGNGYRDATVLTALVDSWTRLIRNSQVDIVVANHAPTAILAARCKGVPTVVTAIGFELPPMSVQSIRTWETSADDRLDRSEAQAVAAINSVLAQSGQDRAVITAELFSQSNILMTTFPELDHYGPRDELHYVGSISGIRGQKIAWPKTSRKRAFAYLRKTVPNVQALLEALASYDMDTVCVMPDADISTIDRYRENRNLTVSVAPVHIADALKVSDLVVTYGTGTIHDALLSGQPLLLCPQNAEQYLASTRAVAMGAGLMLPNGVAPNAIRETLGHLVECGTFAKAARNFSRRYENHSSLTAAAVIVSEIETMLT